MQRLYLLVFSMLIIGCQSVKKANLEFDKKIPVEALRQDIDQSYLALKKFHPELNCYISENDLTKKFDSLKHNINEPLTKQEFYFKLAPVIAKIREGHLRLKIPQRLYTKTEIKKWDKKTPLFGQYTYRVADKRIIVKQATLDSEQKLLPGTEILEINGKKVTDLIAKYQSVMTADGFNKTYYKYALTESFFNYYTAEYGLFDEANLRIKFENKISDVVIKRIDKDDIKKQKYSPSKGTKKLYDFDARTNTYNRSMRFATSDSSVAYIKVKSFSHTASSKFYKQSFNIIKKAKSKYLILDIRNNLGGSLDEINNLYSYLSNQPFTLVKMPEMTFENAALHRDFFHNLSATNKILSAGAYPFFILGNKLLSGKNASGKAIFKETAAKKSKVKKDAFTGKIYVLINGASFSASSILSSKLKFDKRATIVGEETGGANDGAVAGFNNTIKLKNSKLDLPIGLLFIQPNITPENLKRGVIPDVEVDADFFNVFQEQDLQYEWILNDIKKNSD
ncbi:peptidase S41 [Chryseobacterium sp. POL2]|uniref:S41 family peptidase n=1 Tax=Chryseobacterium sp. POL2 TaxID=2713414 RepID=UPI0013E16144|nr:S41 family peptidase [Chryseobacterium sp. POL2]QIG88958.1 peptidase S41 [Chryseobacterium sp. POL2]